MGINIGYISVNHRYQDPYFTVANELGATIIVVCGPGRRVDVENIAAMDDRPDEVTTERQGMADLVSSATVYGDPHEFASDADVDVAWVTYQSDETPEIIESTVKNGVRVVSEKPTARTAIDLEDVAERANELGVTISPTVYYRHSPVAMALHDRASEGFFDDVWTLDGHLNASQFSYRDTDHYLYDRETSRGNTLQWIGPHWVDVVPWTLGDPIAQMNARLHDMAEADMEAGAVLQFETESGTLGMYHTGYYLSDRGKDTHLRLYGTEGQALTPLHHDSLQHEPTVPLDTTSGHPDWTATSKRTVGFEPAYDRFPVWGDFVQDYFEDYSTGYEADDMSVTADDAVQLLRVLDAVYESGERSGWVGVEG